MKKTLFTETFRILFILELIYSLYAKMKVSIQPLFWRFEM